MVMTRSHTHSPLRVRMSRVLRLGRCPNCISNIIEGERAAERQAAARVVALAAARREGFLTRTLNKRWTLTLPQLTAAVVALVVSVVAVTVFSVQGLRRTQQAAELRPAPARRHFNDQELELLLQRVEMRKTRWNPRMRDSFERNLSALDAAVNDPLQQLDATPHDVVSEEALDAAMRGKKELLRQFADL